MFVHHVFFWLKNNLTEAEILKFEKGVKSLLEIKDHFITANVGKPASTRRTVIDSTYSYDLLLVFSDLKNHDAYQVHEIHEKFVNECKDLWEKVLIFDSESF